MKAYVLCVQSACIRVREIPKSVLNSDGSSRQDFEMCVRMHRFPQRYICRTGMERTEHTQLFTVEMKLAWFQGRLAHKPIAARHDTLSVGIRPPSQEIGTVVVDELKVPGRILDECGRGRMETEHGATRRCDERETPMMYELQNWTLLVQCLLNEGTGL